MPAPSTLSARDRAALRAFFTRHPRHERRCECTRAHTLVPDCSCGCHNRSRP